MLERAETGENTLIYRKLAVLGVLLLLMFGKASMHATYGDDSWRSVSPMPTERGALAAVAVGKIIYAIGGWNGRSNHRLATVEAYNPAADQWTRRANMLTPREALVAVALGEKIYAIGGMDETLRCLTTVEEYDPVTGWWTRQADMLTPRSRFAAAVVNGKIYALGGYNGGAIIATVEEYDPTTDRWTRRADMLTARSDFAAAVVGGKIYVFGGVDDNYYVSVTVEEYTPATDQWVRRADMPTIRTGFAAAVVGGRIYLIGGWEGNQLAIVEEYEPAADQWIRRTDMLTARSSLAAAVVGGKIYAIGGQEEYWWNSNVVEVYDPPFYDTDGDGLADDDEVGRYETDPLESDTDGDGLVDGEEASRYGTDPVLSDARVDTDGDGLSNVDEVDKYGTNPQVPDAAADTDGDGLPNVEEVDKYETNPRMFDTDGDGLGDGEELQKGTDPLVSNVITIAKPSEIEQNSKDRSLWWIIGIVGLLSAIVIAALGKAFGDIIAYEWRRWRNQKRRGADSAEISVILPSGFDYDRFKTNFQHFKSIHKYNSIDAQKEVLRKLRSELVNLPLTDLPPEKLKVLFEFFKIIREDMEGEKEEIDREELMMAYLKILSLGRLTRNEIIREKMKDLFLDMIKDLYADETAFLAQRSEAFKILQHLREHEQAFMEKIILYDAYKWTDEEYQVFHNKIELDKFLGDDKNLRKALANKLWNIQAEAEAAGNKTKVERAKFFREMVSIY